jgi:uncharacterized RDD family membrane protein YckC
LTKSHTLKKGSLVVLDTVRVIETPEGVALNLYLAGPVVRALAWSLDMLIRVGIYIAAAILLGYLEAFGWGLWLILIFLVEWFYPLLFELYRDGATPGKRALGIHVLQENGTPLTGAGAIIRNLLRAVDFLPFFYGFGLLAMLTNRRFQRLGDLAAATVVVYNAKFQQHHLSLADLAPLPLPQPLSLVEQQALLHFAERAPALPPARQAELAAILAPLGGHADEAGVRQILQLAAGLLGRPR